MPIKKAEALLEAHIRFERQRLLSGELDAFLLQHTRAILEDLTDVCLNDLVSPAMIQETVQRFVFEHPITPMIPEVVAEIARHVWDYMQQSESTLGDYVTQDDVTQWSGKILEFKHLREQIIHNIISNPLYSELASDLLYQGISDYLTKNPLTKNIPGMGSVMKLGKSVIDKATPNLEASLKKYISANIKYTLKQSEKFLLRKLNDDSLLEQIESNWRRIKPLRIAELTEWVRQEDLEDFFVLGLEQWKLIRSRKELQKVVHHGVAVFFQMFGETPLSELLEELGISEQIIHHELLHYAQPILKKLDDRGLLEKTLRRQYQDFYLSGDALAILEN